MQLKTYRAPDLSTALARAREELGPHALVLATSEIRGRLGLTSVEITVAADRHESLPAFRRSEDDSSDLDPTVRRAVTRLVQSGLSRDLALRFARIASRGLPPRPAASRLADAAERALRELVPFSAAPLAPRVLFVVGPPGAGKTTTVAKLAARIALEGGRRVVLASADAERVGALEQAAIYSKHLGVELTALHGPEDLAATVERAGRRGSVLVDTPGIGSADGERLTALAALRRSAPESEVAVLVPAGLHREEARRVLDRFGATRPTCVAFSKVDDGGRLGELVTALASTGLPLAFLTTGHRVPGDLEPASPRWLAARMLRSAEIDLTSDRTEEHL